MQIASQAHSNHSLKSQSLLKNLVCVTKPISLIIVHVSDLYLLKFSRYKSLDSLKFDSETLDSLKFDSEVNTARHTRIDYFFIFIFFVFTNAYAIG